MPKNAKVPVSERALTQRINRHLLPQEHRLKTSRGAGEAQQLGRHYVLNLQRNFVAFEHKHIDIEQFARKIGVLQPWEELGS
jgi:hypothetical protein